MEYVYYIWNCRYYSILIKNLLHFLFLILMEIFSFSKFKFMLSMSLLSIVFSCHGMSLCICNIFRNFIMKQFWIVLKAFSASNENVVSIFFLSACLYCRLHLPIFICQALSSSLWWILLVFLMCSWIWFVSILLKIPASILIKKTDL